MSPTYRELLARLDVVRSSGVLLGLERVREVLRWLGSPHQAFAAVQIAGTNGKGSAAAMTDAILREAGLRTGLFTSPHLHRFTERIRIGGVEVPGEHLAEFDQRIVATGVPLTYFEVATVLAFLAFAAAGVDVAVLETGLGGRLDAVTVCNPVATAITSIGLDHAEILGDTVEQIAREKAAIAKPGVPMLVGTVSDAVMVEIERVARAAGATVLRIGRDFSPPDARLNLEGAHQASNAAVATELAKKAAFALGRPLGPVAILRGLAGVIWPGRLERVGDVLLDGAHNVDGAIALADALPAGRSRALVISLVRGKDAVAMLSALVPAFDVVVATASRNERAMRAAELADLVRSVNGSVRVQAIDDPLAALAAARHLVRGTAGAQIVVAGSLFLVGQVRGELLGIESDPILSSDPMP